MVLIILIFSDPRSEMNQATTRGQRTIAAVHRPEPEFNPEVELTSENLSSQVAQVDEVGEDALEILPPAELSSSGSQALGLLDLGSRGHVRSK